MHALGMVRAQVSQARNWLEKHTYRPRGNNNVVVALRDCAKLYSESDMRLARMMMFMKDGYTYTRDDELIWVSAIYANHGTCLDGLKESGFDRGYEAIVNLTTSLTNTLTLCIKKGPKEKEKEKENEKSKDILIQLFH